MIDLSNSLEYLQIKERYQFIKKQLEHLITTDLLMSLTSILPSLIAYIQNPTLTILCLNNNCINVEKVSKIKSLISTPEVLERKINTLKGEIAKNYNLMYSILNYSFAPFIFQLDYETEELKKHRFYIHPNEDARLKLSRINRRKAEEAYIANQFDDAIRLFKDAEEKNESDFLSQYQLGLIFFFEKSDYNEAHQYFKKAIKFSQGKSNIIYILSSVFLALLLRIYGIVKENINFIEEASNILTSLYNTNNSNIMVAYALAQTNAILSEKFSNYSSITKDLIQKIVSNNDFIIFQMCHDVAFNNYLSNLEVIVNEINLATKNNIFDMFKKIDEIIQRISQLNKYNPNPSRLATIKSEYKELQNKINNVRTFFEFKEIENSTKINLENFISFFNETNENRMYFELKEVAEEIVKKLHKNEQEILKPLISIETELKQKIIELDKLETSYPTETEEKIIKKKVVVNDKLTLMDKKILASPGWKNMKIFFVIKAVLGCFFSLIISVSIICFFLLFKSEIQPITYVIITIFVLFTPLYGAIGGEVYYFNIENKRRKLIEKIDKLEKLYEVKKNQTNEEIHKLKEKYSIELAEKTNLTFEQAFKVLEAVINNNVEQIKNIIFRKDNTNPSYM